MESTEFSGVFFDWLTEDGVTFQKFNRLVISRLAVEPLPYAHALSFIENAVDLLQNELIGFATDCRGWPRLEDADFRVLVRACRVSAATVSIDFPSLPFSDFTSFRIYWRRMGMDYSDSGDYRTQLVKELFEEVEKQISDTIVGIGLRRLAETLSGATETGWREVDIELKQMRKQYSSAVTHADFSAVGHSCVRVMECLGDVAAKELSRQNSTSVIPPRGEYKNRCYLLIDLELQGPDQAVIRKTFKDVGELAQFAKHKHAPMERDVAFACEGVQLLVALMRRLIK